MLGFHASGRWDLVVGVEDCLLASERGNAARNEVREWAREESVAPYDRPAGTGVLCNLVVREGRRSGQIQTRLVTTPKRFPKPPVDLHTVVDAGSGGSEGPTGALGEETAARASSAGSTSRCPTTPSSRPTPRWPSASTRSPPSTPG